MTLGSDSGGGQGKMPRGVITEAVILFPGKGVVPLRKKEGWGRRSKRRYDVKILKPAHEEVVTSSNRRGVLAL